MSPKQGIQTWEGKIEMMWGFEMQVWKESN